MKHLAIKVVVNAIALWVAVVAVSGITLQTSSGSWAAKVGSLLVLAAVFGIVNALLKPLLKLVSLPLIVLTLGLFTFVVNAVLLQLTSWVAQAVGLAFHIDHFFWDAIVGALVITIVGMIANLLLPDEDEV